ncbi:MAG: hypothetical protein INR69_16855 [Mucilaginibacter polytrichastri]|nr:hypothetical protein [Mucilaginibacter polytrichastri]
MFDKAPSDREGALPFYRTAFFTFIFSSSSAFRFELIKHSIMKKMMALAAALVLSAGLITAQAQPAQKDSTKTKTHKMHKANKAGKKSMKKDTTKA